MVNMLDKLVFKAHVIDNVYFYMTFLWRAYRFFMEI